MAIIVKQVEGPTEKSTQEIEQSLLEKAEAQRKEKEAADAAAAASAAGAGPDGAGGGASPIEFKDEDVLSYLGKKLNKQISSFDELAAPAQSEPLPEDVAAFAKFKKETGRGFEDFMKLREDFDSMDHDKLLRRYLSDTQPELDAEDIDAMMGDYTFDETLDPEEVVRKKRIEKKKIVAQAKQHFNSKKEAYKVPLESSEASLSDEEKEALRMLRENKGKPNQYEEEARRKRKWFEEKTDALFNQEFKGFEFDIDGTKMIYAPGDATELRKAQDTPANFINRFLDENGLMKDAAGYHRSLAIAMNPDKFAAYFYEQGKAAATDGTMRKLKNIQMDERRAPEVIKKSGMTVKAVEPDSGRRLKIPSRKK